MTDYKDTTNRHLRHKLQSLSRRIDELEEASSKLQKSEDELLDLQDKIIQAEGSNSALLSEVDTLRKRVLKIEGKDEEVRKAEDLCRQVREKLEKEENLTKDLKGEIELLQKRMVELEKLEEAFSKSKSDCTQLCHSLNEEKNMTKKLSTEVEALKARMKEVDSSEMKLDKAEQTLTGELEKLKILSKTFVSERKRLLEKQKEDEKLILDLTEKLKQNKMIITADQSRNSNNLQERQTEIGDLRIEDDLSPSQTSKLLHKKSLDLLNLSDVGFRRKTDNEKNSSDGQEDNKVRELTQEIERLKTRLKQLELVEKDLKKVESINEELQEKFDQESNRCKALNDQVEQLKLQLNVNSGGFQGRILENGKAENEEVSVHGGCRQEKVKIRSIAPESPLSKNKSREDSPQQRSKFRNKEFSQSEENSPKFPRRALSPAHKNKRLLKGNVSLADGGKERGKGVEQKASTISSAPPSESKKASVLSRYPPAVNDQKTWKSSVKLGENEKRSQSENLSRNVSSDGESSISETRMDDLKKVIHSSIDFPVPGQSQESPAAGLSKANGMYTAYKSHVSPQLHSDQGSEGHSSASETESTGSRKSGEEPEAGHGAMVINNRTTAVKSQRSTCLLESQAESSFIQSSREHTRPQVVESTSQEPSLTSTGINIRRVYSPREALRSKAVIKPAIVEIDRKEVMISGGGAEPLMSNGKPKISTKPMLPSKMTSSITIYPSDPSSSRTSSRSSSLSSEPPTQRHTSTSNIVISPSEHTGSMSIPYEISIPKSEIGLRPALDGDDLEMVEVESSCVDTQVRSKSSFILKSPEVTDSNDMESGFESSSSSSGSGGTSTTITSWRSHHLKGSRDDCLKDMRNVTVRSTWKKRGVASASMDDSCRASRIDGSEDEAESSTTWRAYRATTVLDTDDSHSTNTITANTRTGKPSPAEVYMRRINSVMTSRESQEPILRNKSSMSPPEGGMRKSIQHEPVIAQELLPWNRAASSALEDDFQSSRRKHTADSIPKAEVASKRPLSKLETSPGGVPSQPERRGLGGRPWNQRQYDN